MARKKITRSATAVNLSGQLGNALAYHAGERMRHLFLFLFATDAACRLVNAELGAAFKPGSMIKEAASHQVDSGLRSNDQTRDVFDETDANIIQVPSTSFNKIDAAHYCNLGLEPSNWARLTAAAESLKGDTAVEMIEKAEIYTANTVWLPQRVNIGPDRIIDQLHYVMAQGIFADGQPVLSVLRLQAYATNATRVIMAYQGTLQGKAGLQACCTCYLMAYANQPMEEKAMVIAGNIRSECEALKMSVADYIA